MRRRGQRVKDIDILLSSILLVRTSAYPEARFASGPHILLWHPTVYLDCIRVSCYDMDWQFPPSVKRVTKFSFFRAI